MRSRIRIIGVLAAVLCACGGDDGDDGGTGGTGGSGKCPAFSACGGDPVGDWTANEVCVSDPDALFKQAVNQPECKNALKSSSDADASGDYKLGADKKAVSTIVVSGTGVFSFDDACVKALSVATSAASECSKVQTELAKASGVKSATCTAKAPNCECNVSLEMSLGGMGNYTVNGDKLTVNNLVQPFCVQGNTLKLQTTSMGVTAFFTLTKK